MTDWARACKGGERRVRTSCGWAVRGMDGSGCDRVPRAGKLEWDSKNLRFTNSAEANKVCEAGVPEGLGVEALGLRSIE